MHDHLSGHESKKPQLLQISPAPYQKPHDHQTRFMVGLDVGSTTVKAMVVEAATDKAVWQDYQRHETKQPEKTLEFLRRMHADVGLNQHNTRIFMTGSGGGSIAEQIGAKFVQEVTAVSLAVEKLHPDFRLLSGGSKTIVDKINFRLHYRHVVLRAALQDEARSQGREIRNTGDIEKNIFRKHRRKTGEDLFRTPALPLEVHDVGLHEHTTRNEETRCNFCKNNCLRTFIDIRTAPKDEMAFIPIQKVTKVPLMHGEQRLIIATCEKGLVEDINDMKDIKAGLDDVKAKFPNFVDFAAH